MSLCVIPVTARAKTCNLHTLVAMPRGPEAAAWDDVASQTESSIFKPSIAFGLAYLKLLGVRLGAWYLIVLCSNHNCAMVLPHYHPTLVVCDCGSAGRLSVSEETCERLISLLWKTCFIASLHQRKALLLYTVSWKP